MASSNPNIEQLNYYRVLYPNGFEDRLFSPSSSSYLRYSDAVAFPKAPFVLQSPEEAVARCIALNSHDWESVRGRIAKKDWPESLLCQATRGLAVYHLQDGKPVVAIYSGCDSALNLALSRPDLMGRVVPMGDVRGVLSWAEKNDGFVEPVGLLELSVKEDNCRTPFGQHPANQAILGKNMAEGYALVRRKLGYDTGFTGILDAERIVDAGVTKKMAALRWVGVGFDYIDDYVDVFYDVGNYGRAAGVASGAEIFHRK